MVASQNSHISACDQQEAAVSNTCGGGVDEGSCGAVGVKVNDVKRVCTEPGTTLEHNLWSMIINSGLEAIWKITPSLIDNTQITES